MNDDDLLLVCLAQYEWECAREVRGGGFLGVSDGELREDGGFELREDGGFELRDGP